MKREREREDEEEETVAWREGVGYVFSFSFSKRVFFSFNYFLYSFFFNYCLVQKDTVYLGKLLNILSHKTSDLSVTCVKLNYVGFIFFS